MIKVIMHNDKVIESQDKEIVQLCHVQRIGHFDLLLL